MDFDKSRFHEEVTREYIALVNIITMKVTQGFRWAEIYSSLSLVCHGSWSGFLFSLKITQTTSVTHRISAAHSVQYKRGWYGQRREVIQDKKLR